MFMKLPSKVHGDAHFQDFMKLRARPAYLRLPISPKHIPLTSGKYLELVGPSNLFPGMNDHLYHHDSALLWPVALIIIDEG